MAMVMTMAARSALSSRISPLPYSRAFFTDRYVWDIRTHSSRIVPPFNFGAVFMGDNTAFVVERFRKYHRTLTDPGWHFLIPFIDRVARVYIMNQPQQILNDLYFTPADQSVVVSLSYASYFEHVDAKLAYTVKDTLLETQRALDDKLTSEILSRFSDVNRLLDDAERRLLCQNALKASNAETCHWGVKCVLCDLGLPSFAPEVTRREMEGTKLKQRSRELVVGDVLVGLASYSVTSVL